MPSNAVVSLSFKISVIAIFGVAVGTLAWWYVGTRGSPHEEKEEHTEAPALKLFDKSARFAVKPAVINLFVKAPGTVDFHPKHALRLHPTFPGVVTHVHKNLGDKVGPGDVLGTIDSNVGFQTNVVVSPIAGIVLAKNISVGQTVAPEEELFSVGDTSRLRARLAVSMRDINRIKAGQEVILVSESMQTIHSTVTFISPILDEETRTATAIVDFSSPDFLPGMFVTGAFVIERKSVEKSIPAIFCNEINNNISVLVVTPTGAETRKIVSGISDYHNCEILNGLDTGTEVLMKNALPLISETKDEDHHDD